MPTGRLVLAIDTSTEAAGVAVLGDKARVSLCWNAGREQTTTVLDQIDRCLSLAGVGPGEITAVAVATGPGMFNGLRVGMSLAKGFAYGLDQPIVGVSTLRVAADPWLGLGRDVVTVVAAGRGRVVWQRFSNAGEPLGEGPVNATLTDLNDAVRLNPDCLVAGEVPESDAALMRVSGVVVRVGDEGRRDPLALARLASERLAAGESDNLVTIEPLYVHGRRAAVAG